MAYILVPVLLGLLVLLLCCVTIVLVSRGRKASKEKGKEVKGQKNKDEKNKKAVAKKTKVPEKTNF